MKNLYSSLNGLSIETRTCKAQFTILECLATSLHPADPRVIWSGTRK